MRAGRRPTVALRLTHVTTTKTTHGDEITATTTTTVQGAVFEPERILERTGTNAAVVQPASFNVPGLHDLDADDTLEEGTVGADGTFTALDPPRTWQVVGGGTHWLDRTKVPVTAVRTV